MEILKQTKLTRAEWDSIEVPVSDEERDTLRLIISGYDNPQIKHNKKTSLFSFIKIEVSDEIELYLYNKYFDPIIQKMINKYNKETYNKERYNKERAKSDNKGSNTRYSEGAEAEGIDIPLPKQSTLKKLKSVDSLRLQNLDANIQRSGSSIYEFLLLEFTEELLKNIGKGKTKYAFYLYTLIQLKKNSIRNINKYVTEFVDSVIEHINQRINITDIIEQAYEFIEKNKYLLEFQDKELFSHQKDIFTVFRSNIGVPKLILYTAPTGTGKTLSPLGLATEYRVIFVCVARHIGLALAKSAVSMEKKIAFAFGAETATDIRLHYFAAVDFTKDRRSGGIRKVDNSNGTKVEMMICDAQSYITAMHYMLAFNPRERIITYWDEPTISMDYPEHELHQVLHRNWSQNQIPNMVLSCATLPREDEIYDTIADFRCKFEGAEVHSITSYDCRKSIPIITTEGHCALPHTLYSDFNNLQSCIEYCESNKTVLRYFDLKEAVRFILFANRLKQPKELKTELEKQSEESILPELYLLNNYFGAGIAEITMNSLKIYYLEVLKRIPEERWTEIYEHMNSTKKYKYERPVISKTSSLDISNNPKTTGGGALRRTASISADLSKTNKIPEVKSASIKITTEDAYTLTDGPTIFLTEDVAKIAHFYIQQTAIPPEIFQNILRKITKNKDLSEKISALEQHLEDTDKSTVSKTGGDNSKKEAKMADPDSINGSKDPELKKKYKELDDLRAQIHFISLDTAYIPNTTPHQIKWSPTVSGSDTVSAAAFVPTIEEQVVRDIMSIDIENYQKVLLLMGIGLFMEDLNPKYLEIMKTMAYEQQLFMIIASSDYIYGTNYSFCHGFIGKDLSNMTQQKTLQSLGRIGRVSIQQTYTVRFRDDTMIRNLFKKQEENLEAVNMSKIFTSD